MKNLLKISVGALAFSAMWFAPVYAEFSDPGTEYSTATVDRWSDDQINEFVEKANSFACIISKARPDVLPNASFEVLMSEVECGLTEEKINGSLLSNRDTLSSSVMKTSRASATSNQEGQFWFNSQEDMKFIGNMVIKKSGTELPPYGEWNLGYVMNAFTDDIPGAAGDEFTALTSPIAGYVDIAAATSAEGGGIIMSSYELNDMTKKSSLGSLQDTVMSSTIQYYDASLANARILGRTVGADDGGNAVDIITAAKTNATHIYKAVFQGVADGNPTLSCTKRDSTWKTVHRYGVFNKSTGDKVLINGGFGFDFTDGSTASRGFLSLHGAFFDDPTTAFTKAAPTMAVSAQNDAATPYTLSWAPGKLSERTPVSETLSASGITYFKKYSDNGEVQVQVTKVGGTYQATYHPIGSKPTANPISDPFNGVSDDALMKKVASGGTNAGIDDHPWIGWMYSPEKRTEVYWNGGNSIKFFNEKNASADATLLGKATGWTALIATQNNAPATVANYPITGTNWFVDNLDGYGYARKSDSLNDTFYFTALTPPTGLLARTLYIDPTGNGPSSDDRAVMFDFSANERNDKYTSFSAGAVATTMKITMGSNNEYVQWPFKSLELKDNVTNKEYKWRTGAFGWDNSVIALKADNTVYALDEPMMLTYAHAAAKDMNNNKEITFIKDRYNPHNPVPTQCLDGVGSRKYPGGGNVAVVQCSVDPTDFGTKTYSLRYNGKWVEGLPEMNARGNENDTNSFRVTMINPIAGTVVTNTVAGIITNYVLKPLAVSESYLKEPTFANCANGTPDISFNTLALGTSTSFGWDLSKLPSPTKVPTPGQLWTDQPAKSTLKCTVNSGDATACIP